MYGLREFILTSEGELRLLKPPTVKLFFNFQFFYLFFSFFFTHLGSPLITPFTLFIVLRLIF